jgi:hypothetical protein
LTRYALKRRFAPKEGHAMNPDVTKKPPVTARSARQERRQIRLRAYELYEARGREDGHELDDWLRAEEEITQKKVRSIAA